MESKQELREAVKHLRQKMKPAVVDKYAQTIASGVMQLADFETAKRVHIYNPIEYYNEVPTQSLVKQIHDRYPTIEVISPGPTKDEPMPTEKFDIIIVPLVAFDDRCHRIGFGVGWYDKFLATQPKAKKIGLAFWLQRVAYIENEPHDVPLDMVVTEALVYAKN